MFNQQLANLRTSIEWAQRDQSLDIFRMAGAQLEKLECYVCCLSSQQQQQAYQAIESMLPMEWPLWMEACRYDDVLVQAPSATLH
ncbi:hypothetical protein [Dasania marina]|uniref:hypothetical protein n=1 Tax=Dasania marina TaxID=471499 RepID=UPI00037F3E1D|nr:hypothetical protein [Dasania marina]|tara:strand:- start:4564 stop:4818 length:255 start_codon:yes stop_codon:yes gene_type:complete